VNGVEARPNLSSTHQRRRIGRHHWARGSTIAGVLQPSLASARTERLPSGKSPHPRTGANFFSAWLAEFRKPCTHRCKFQRGSSEFHCAGDVSLQCKNRASTASAHMRMETVREIADGPVLMTRLHNPRSARGKFSIDCSVNCLKIGSEVGPLVHSRLIGCRRGTSTGSRTGGLHHGRFRHEILESQ